VALGASNTEGKGRGGTNMGVPREQAYPAQLERLLRTRGINARVMNAGVAGDTTAGMLARLGSAVPNGTSVLILQPGGNDARHGASSGERLLTSPRSGGACRPVASPSSCWRGSAPFADTGSPTVSTLAPKATWRSPRSSCRK
jgi:lysophospholipase L1-like esterase